MAVVAEVVGVGRAFAVELRVDIGAKGTERHLRGEVPLRVVMPSRLRVDLRAEVVGHRELCVRARAHHQPGGQRGAGRDPPRQAHGRGLRRRRAPSARPITSAIAARPAAPAERLRVPDTAHRPPLAPPGVGIPPGIVLVSSPLR